MEWSDGHEQTPPWSGDTMAGLKSWGTSESCNRKAETVSPSETKVQVWLQGVPTPQPPLPDPRQTLKGDSWEQRVNWKDAPAAPCGGLCWSHPTRAGPNSQAVAVAEGGFYSWQRRGISSSLAVFPACACPCQALLPHRSKISATEPGGHHLNVFLLCCSITVFESVNWHSFLLHWSTRTWNCLEWQGGLS